MPGLFGVVDLRRQGRAAEIDGLATEVAKRLTRRPDYSVEWKRGDWAVIGRIGASFHNNTPWSAELQSPAVSGILQNPLEGLTALARRDFAAARGFFAAACAGQDGFALLADRRASVPVFFAVHDGLLVFAPEVKGVVAVRGLSREVDSAAYASFVASGHLLADQTLFRSVRRLRGGHALSVDANGEVRLGAYWRFRPGIRSGELPHASLQKELVDRVEAAVERNLRDPGHTAILLSGGADSRGMLCAALKVIPAADIHAVTWTGDEGGRRSDFDVARWVAASCGIQHHVLHTTVDAYVADFQKSATIIDGLSDLSPFHPQYYRLAEEISGSGLPIVLRGDEVFGWWHPVSSFGEALSAVGLRSLKEAGAESLLRPELHRDLHEAWSTKIAGITAEVGGLSPSQAKDAFYFDHRLQGYLNTGGMLRQASTDHRNPLLDESILDFMEFVPDGLRQHKLLFQQGMAQRYPQLWRVGIAGSVNTENWSTIYARNKAIHEFIADEFSDSKSGVWDFLNRQHAGTLLDLVDRLNDVKARLRSNIKSILRSALEFSPPALMALVSRPGKRAPTGATRLIMRTLALKYWHDTMRYG